MYNATVCPFDKGQIFLLNDVKPTVGTIRAHNYVIMSNSCGNGKTVQAMTITSLASGDKQGAVPVMLLNGKVSFILPYNMYNFTYKDFDLKNYRGTIQDDIYLKNDFLDMLLNLYLYFNNFQTIMKKDELITKYNDYIENFWKIYSHDSEFRLTKNNFKMAIIKDTEPLSRQITGMVTPSGVCENNHETIHKEENVKPKRTGRVITVEMIEEDQKKRNQSCRGRKPKFSESVKLEIIKDYNSGLNMRTLSKKYTCSVNTISRIVK